MHVISINDSQDPNIRLFSQLTNHQLRNRLDPERGVLIAESEKVIRVALASGVEPIAFLLDERWLTRLGDVLEGLSDDVPIYTLPRDEIATITGFNVTRGALCAMRRPSPTPLASVLEGASRVAVLEGIVDTTNVGAITRSAAALGVDGLILTPTCADPLSRRAIRVSMGTIFRIPWAWACRDKDQWPREGLAALSAAGFTSAALALRDDALALDDPKVGSTPRLALVFGTEGDGLAPDTIASCDMTVTIPMMNGVDSLNVAAASAVVFWELCRKG